MTHRRREQGAALHCLSQQLPGTQQDTGCHLQQMHHAIKSHHLVTWCASNSDILITLYFICVRRKLHCKSSARHNFNLIFYHLSHVDPTRPDPTRPGPTRGSGQQSCNSGVLCSKACIHRRRAKRLMQTCFDFDRNVINAGVTIGDHVCMLVVDTLNVCSDLNVHLCIGYSMHGLQLLMRV